MVVVLEIRLLASNLGFCVFGHNVCESQPFEYGAAGLYSVLHSMHQHPHSLLTCSAQLRAWQT